MAATLEALKGAQLDALLASLDAGGLQPIETRAVKLERAPVPAHKGLVVFEYPGTAKSVSKARRDVVDLTRRFVTGERVPNAPIIRAASWGEVKEVVAAAEAFASDGVTNALIHGQMEGKTLRLGVGVAPDGSLVYAIPDDNPQTGLTQNDAGHGNGIRMMADVMTRIGVATPAVIERGGGETPLVEVKAFWGVRSPKHLLTVPQPRSPGAPARPTPRR